MKLTKKLLPALGMLALSTCMMVTSTFAWFSMNDTVEANGMTVVARGNQVYLQIINADGTFNPGDDQIEAEALTTYEDENDKLLPTNVKTLSGSAYSNFSGSGALSWVTAVGEDFNDATATEAGYKAVEVDPSTGDAPSYFLKNDFYIRLDPTAGAASADHKLAVESVIITQKTVGEIQDFSRSVSVLVYDNVSQMGSLWGYEDTSEEGEDPEWTWGCLTNQNLTSTNFQVFDKSEKISIYVFFNGDHETCTLENLAQAFEEEYSVVVNFTVAKDYT